MEKRAAGNAASKTGNGALDVPSAISEAERWLEETEPDWRAPDPGSQEQYREEAQKGDAEAQARLATLLLAGEAPARYPKEGAAWMERSAKAGNAWAQMCYGLLLLNGQLVRKSVGKGNKFLQMAARQGLGYAQYLAGIALLETGQDDQRLAEEWLERACESGVDAAYEVLAARRDVRQVVEQHGHNACGLDEEQYGPDAYKLDDELARCADAEDLMAEARLGNPSIQLIVASAFQSLDNPAAPERALYWLKQSAKGGFDLAQDLLGRFYWKGIFVPQDRQEAIYWVEKSTEGNNPLAWLHLSHMYSDMGDDEEAFECMLQGASGGLERAMCELAMMFEDGVGVEADMEQAVRWWKAAADRRYPDGLVRLAVLHLLGERVEEDHEKAIRLLQEEAKENNVDAMLLLADIARRGDPETGRQPSASDARRWERRIVRLGYDLFDVRCSLGELCGSMHPLEREGDDWPRVSPRWSRKLAGDERDSWTEGAASSIREEGRLAGSTRRRDESRNGGTT